MLDVEALRCREIPLNCAAHITFSCENAYFLHSFTSQFLQYTNVFVHFVLFVLFCFKQICYFCWYATILLSIKYLCFWYVILGKGVLLLNLYLDACLFFFWFVDLADWIIFGCFKNYIGINSELNCTETYPSKNCGDPRWALTITPPTAWTHQTIITKWSSGYTDQPYRPACACLRQPGAPYFTWV